MTRAIALLTLCLLCLAGCGDEETFTPTSASGRATWLTYGCTWISGAKVCHGPGKDHCTTTDKDGAFSLSDLPAGRDAYLVFYAKDAAQPVQTATYPLTDKPLQDLSFQVPSALVWKAFEGLVGAKADPATCQISTTVMANNKVLWPCEMPGEPGATVSIAPALAAKHGPVYFDKMTLPDPKLTETSKDGGAVFINVPPGEYTLSAHKAGITFEPIRVTCRAGVLVNPSPPWGFKRKE